MPPHMSPDTIKILWTIMGGVAGCAALLGGYRVLVSYLEKRADEDRRALEELIKVVSAHGDRIVSLESWQLSQSSASNDMKAAIRELGRDIHDIRPWLARLDEALRGQSKTQDAMMKMLSQLVRDQQSGRRGG